ncbi:hypothetical protein EMIT0373P_60477 [Pseudomonas chlororaphis]
MPDHADHLVLVDQAVGYGHSLFRFASVVALDQDDLLAVDAALGVDFVSRCLCTLHVLLAKCRVGACHGARYADLEVGLSKRRNTQRSCHCEGQKAFLVKRLGHEVVLQGFFSWHCDFTECSEQGPCHWFFILKKVALLLLFRLFRALFYWACNRLNRGR